MHPILSKLLKKRKIETVDKLSPEERSDFDRWNKILSKDEVSVSDVAEFCRIQIRTIEGQWRDLGNSTQKNERLISMHTVYNAILGSLTSSKAERESLENYLNSLLTEKGGGV